MQSKNILLDLGALQQARQNLELEGFRVETAPVEMLELGVLLAAYHPERQEGFLLSGPEVQLVARHGPNVLDPHQTPDDSRPRWQRPDTRNREQKYCEAALARAVAEVASAPVGNRNNILSRAAFGLGQLENLGLDRDRVQQALEQAALAAGLTLQEARPTIRRGLEAGSRKPRELPDFGYSDTAGYQAGIQNKPASRREKPHLGYSDTYIPSLGDSRPPKLKGGS